MVLTVAPFSFVPAKSAVKDQNAKFMSLIVLEMTNIDWINYLLFFVWKCDSHTLAFSLTITWLTKVNTISRSHLYHWFILLKMLFDFKQSHYVWFFGYRVNREFWFLVIVLLIYQIIIFLFRTRLSHIILFTYFTDSNFRNSCFWSFFFNMWLLLCMRSI